MSAKLGAVHRLNYIGSKYQLLDWLTESILTATGWESLAGKSLADLFAGTGIVSHYFRVLGARVVSNDAELYSAVITKAFTCSTYTSAVSAAITQLQGEISAGAHLTEAGFITRNYSPFNGCERKFFTVENARRIDYLRRRIEQLRLTLSEDEATFLLASLLLSADAVSNVPAVYGCYLKEFKDKAKQELVLKPIHIVTESAAGNSAYHSDVLSAELLAAVNVDAVYLDPPYNKRQYSKNYFPLNIIAMSSNAVAALPALKGVTGIPDNCFLSPFCKKEAVVGEAFEKLFSGLKAKWIFLSYSSESTVSKDAIVAMMEKHGQVTVVERDHKRFKSFEYNQTGGTKEYLFCLKKAG